MNKTKIVSLIGAGVLLMVVIILLVSKSEIITTALTIEEVINLPAVVNNLDFDITSDVVKAQKVLSDYRVNKEYKQVKKWAWVNKKKKTRRYWTEKKLVNYDVLLAVEHIKDRQIKVIRLTNKGKESNAAGFEVDFEKANGVNTQYEVTHPDGYIVLALKRLINGRKGGDKDVIYSPYSKQLDVPAIRRQGFEYVKNIIQLARERLANKQVSSLAFGSRLVVEVVPVDVATVLLLIEHIDPTRFNALPIEQLINEVLTVISLNRERAYTYAVSPAGARGLFQFIPRTYKSIIRQYPQAGLNSNFIAGMNNHINAAAASFLLFDSDLSYTDIEHRNFLIQNKDALGYYLASAYNGGAYRTVRAIEEHGENWVNYVLPETQVYLKKYKAVANILLK